LSVLPARYRRNVVSTYLVTGTTALVALVMTPVLARGLGAEGYGIWVLVASFALYLELLELGFGKVAPKEVAGAAALGDDARVRASIATAFWILAALGAVALLVALLVAAVFPALFDIDPGLRTAAQILVLLILVDLAVSIPLDTFGGVLMGLQRFDLLNWTLVTVVVGQAIAWSLVILLGGGLVWLGVVTVALSLGGQLARYVLARGLVANVSLSPRRIDRSLLRPFTGLSVWFAILDLAAIVLLRLDVLVVGLAVGVAAAGIYAVGQRLTLVLDLLIVPVTKAFFPHSAHLSAGEDLAGLRRSLLFGTRMSLAIAAPIALALALLAGSILDVWVGEGFDEAATVIVLLAAAATVTALTRTGLMMLQGTGRVRVPAMITGAEAALNLALSLVLVATMGLAGVALGTLIATVVVNLGIFYPYVCRSFGVPVVSFSWTLARAHLPAVAVALPLGLLLAAVTPSPLLAVGAVGPAVVGVYLAVLARTGLSGEERRALWEALRRRRVNPTPPGL
jgi:O-antigen/teichoic acid export membrane protein